MKKNKEVKYLRELIFEYEEKGLIKKELSIAKKVRLAFLYREMFLKSKKGHYSYYLLPIVISRIIDKVPDDFIFTLDSLKKDLKIKYDVAYLGFKTFRSIDYKEKFIEMFVDNFINKKTGQQKVFKKFGKNKY